MSFNHRHPEGVHPDLTSRDDKIWNLGVYKACLGSWSMMNAAIKASRDELAMIQEDGDMLTEALESSVNPIGTMEGANKHFLRHHGLELLRDVDNCG